MVAASPSNPGYSATPLPKKLGIKAASTLALIGAPEGFLDTLGALPGGVRIKHRRGGHAYDVTLWFVRTRRELERGMVGMAGWAGNGHLWITWPKRASGLAPDLSGGVIRKAALATGLVDFKVCAIDATWSGLLFTRRRG